MTSSRFFAIRGPETTYGDGATGSTWYKVRVTGMGDPVNRNPAFEEACDISIASYAVGGPYKVSGTVDALLRFKSFDPFFTSMLGASTGGKYQMGDHPKSYAFKIGDDQANVTGMQTKYYGCGISSMELTFAVKEFVKAKMTWIGQMGQVETSPSEPSFLVDPGVASTNDPVAVYYNAIIKVNGSPIRCKSMTLRMDRKFDEDYMFIGSPLLQGLYMNAQTEMGGTMTLGGGEWSELKYVLTGATNTNSITATMQTNSAGTENKNELYSGTFEVDCHDLNGVLVGTIVAGEVVFTESNRTVTGRNQWDKSITYRLTSAASTDTYIEPA